MNIMYKLILVVICFTFIGCFSYDDNGFEDIRLTIEDSFIFENTRDYKVGDTVIFELKFSRYMEEEGYINLLDLYETTNEKQFGYSFGVSKYSDFSKRFESLTIDPQFLIAQQSDSFNYYSYHNHNTIAILNEAQDAYISKVGIIMVENGRFKLDFENVYLVNGNRSFIDDKIHISIKHSLINHTASDFEFNVIE
ncbi:hypothetical protein GH721_15495 [Kriegella sp. EG-1]|nr:hypothetical protein [Flavobacteriaceae bacterium EG-1]